MFAENGRVVSHFLVAARISLPVTFAFPVTKHSTSLHADQITTWCKRVHAGVSGRLLAGQLTQLLHPSRQPGPEIEQSLFTTMLTV